jgi:hypothetical protein
MSISLISNPPYNLKWQHPPFAQMQPRFCEAEMPPEGNANFAFVLSALEQITSRAILLLPNSVLTTENRAEQDIKKMLVDKNYIDAVVLCPRNMFESTDIPTCILVLSKIKKTTDIVFVDMRAACVQEERKQNGQFGGASHERRTYSKKFNVFRKADIDKAISAISSRSDIPAFSRRVSPSVVAENGYTLTPARYREFEGEAVKRREYADIIADINRIVDEKNAVKLTINETLARQLGLSDVVEIKKASAANGTLLNNSLSFTGCKIESDNYISTTKNKNEFSFSNTSKEIVSSVLMMILQMWKQHIYYLNNEENRYLAELRDTMLPDLMNGKIKLEMQATKAGEGGQNGD